MTCITGDSTFVEKDLDTIGIAIFFQPFVRTVVSALMDPD